MRKLFFLVFLFCFFLLGISAAILFYTQYMIFDIKDIPMDVRVSGHVGFNLDTDKLHFGRATSPGGAERAITVTNHHTRPLYVKIRTYGELAEWVSYKEYDLLFPANTSRDIMFSVSVPEGITEGDYNGTVRIIFMRPLI